MTLADALSVLSTLFGTILNFLNSVQLFGVSLSVFIIAAFICSSLMTLIFDIDRSGSKGKEKGE